MCAYFLPNHLLTVTFGSDNRNERDKRLMLVSVWLFVFTQLCFAVANDMQVELLMEP